MANHLSNRTAASNRGTDLAGSNSPLSGRCCVPRPAQRSTAKLASGLAMRGLPRVNRNPVVPSQWVY